TFTPGQYYTYPPVHLAILAVLTLPIVLVGVARSPSLALPDLVATLLSVPYMSAISYVARAVTLVLSLGIVLGLARIAEELRAHELGLDSAPADASRGLLTCRWADDRVRRAGYFTAAFAGVNVSCTYYAHTTNLDVPYLFWATWSLLFFTRALARREPYFLRRAFVLAVLAVGTKDQAYGLVLLSFPVAFALWFAFDAWAREHRRTVLRETAMALAFAVSLFLVVDAVLVNPYGFLARVKFLTGSASQDFVEYTRDWSGRLGLLADAVRLSHLQYPAPLGIAILVGICLVFARIRGVSSGRRVTHFVVASLPMLAAVSFTLLFNFTALRTNARFLLPQALVLAVYGGLALDAIAFGVSSRAIRMALQGGVALALAAGLYVCMAVDATLLGDPRYDAEAWLASRVRPGETIETYGLNVYMPRMPSHARVIRVGPEPPGKRNPMPGIEEVQAPFGDARSRGARFLVVSTGWVWRYVERHGDLGFGRQRPPTVHRSVVDKDATDFFDGLLGGDRGFKLVHEAVYDNRVFPLVDPHGASGKLLWIFERTPD
ncbi:MAG TPA: hypothetical protein VM580_07015, partial [Labilithrix sp.]|nr:hypothetical protein [Labilithrix sp.]